MFKLLRDDAHDTLPPPEEPPTLPNLGTLCEATEPPDLARAIYDLKASEVARGLAIASFTEQLRSFIDDFRAPSGASQP